MARCKLRLAYDGGAYSGWARQPGLPTVQQTLESGIEQALGRLGLVPELPVTVAGRTDAGVHASGQVVHFDVPQVARQMIDVDRFPRFVNGYMPADVRVNEFAWVPGDFDARFSALSRSYRYLVVDDVKRWEPALRGMSVLWPYPVDVGAMNQAATLLVGEHDFAAFCRPRPGATTIRELFSCKWTRFESYPGWPLVLELRADAFCHNMVRSLAGALLTVGRGLRDRPWIADLLTAGQRDSSIPVLPPQGLTLVDVTYPDESQLGTRSQITRNLRHLTGNKHI